MPRLTYEDRVRRLDTFIAEGRLIRKVFTSQDAKGRATACLLAALAPEVAKSEDPDDCPATVMPTWLAHLTPWIDDAGSDRAWPATVRRYAALARRWRVLDARAWRGLQFTVALIALDTVLAAGPRGVVDPHGIVVRVRDLCVTARDGGRVEAGAWEEARCAARDTLYFAAYDTLASPAQRVAIEAAAWSSGSVDSAQMLEEVLRAARSRERAKYDMIDAAASAKIERAMVRAADRLNKQILDAIEAAIVAKEAPRG